MSRPVLIPLAAIAALLVLGVLVVWQPASLMHLGAEVAALRTREARLEEERRALRMGMARMAAPEQLAKGQSKGAWAMKDEKTQEVIQRVRDTRP